MSFADSLTSPVRCEERVVDDERFCLANSQAFFDQEDQQAINARYFKEADKCQDLRKKQQWAEAEEVCKAAIPLAEHSGSGSYQDARL